MSSPNLSGRPWKKEVLFHAQEDCLKRTTYERSEKALLFSTTAGAEFIDWERPRFYSLAMTIFEALTQRRTIHSYKPGAVPDEVLERALTCANAAPNHKLTFPWKFYVLGKVARSTLATLSMAKLPQPPTEEQRKDASSKFGDPGLLIVATQKRSSDPVRDREDYAATSAAIENLMVSLWADGFGSKWSTGKITTDPKTYTLIGANPETETIVGFVWGGIPAAIPAPITRPQLSDICVPID